MRNDWVEVELEKLLVLSKEKYKPTDTKTLFYIGLEHIEKGTGKLLDYVAEEDITTVKNSFEKGDILYGKLRPYLNKVHLAQKDGVCSTDILVLKPSKYINPIFFLNFMLSRSFVNYMSANTNGVNLPRVSTKYVQNYKLPLPPLPEQRAIVAKIDELFSELDNGIANLKAAQAKLDIYRQALLKQAFEGELTREWREKQTDLPSADVCLEQVKNDRLKFNQELLSTWSKLFESNPTLKKPKTISLELQLNYDLKNYYFDIPDAWFWGNLNFITSKLGDGLHGTPIYSDGDYYFINGNNLNDGFINLKDSTKTVSKEEFEKYKKDLSNRTILVSINGTLGSVAFYSGELVVLGKSVCYFNLVESINKKYIYWLIVSHFFQQYAVKTATGSTIKNVPLKAMRDLPIPICSITEQTQIVQEIEARLSVCDKLAETIQTSLQQAEALRQSILKKAFEGRLLTETELQTCKAQADWMPAEQLLAQIKSTKAK